MVCLGKLDSGGKFDVQSSSPLQNVLAFLVDLSKGQDLRLSKGQDFESLLSEVLAFGQPASGSLVV